MRPRRPIQICILLLACIIAPARGQQGSNKPYLLHLPGIGGHMLIDDRVTAGLLAGGINAELEIYDWTENDPGLPALSNYDRNQKQATKISDHIAALRRAAPQRRIIVTSHSGGTAIAIWALERLPADMQIDSLVMMASALSPQYDMSKGLAHVKGKAYAFTSTIDPVVGLGTRMMGTMDRQYVDSAGAVGFTMPAGGDAKQYAKLVGIPYDSNWIQLGNYGDHIGAMNRPFAARILAPLLLTGQLPHLAPATRPASNPSNAPAGG